MLPGCTVRRKNFGRENWDKCGFEPGVIIRHLGFFRCGSVICFDCIIMAYSTSINCVSECRFSGYSGLETFCCSLKLKDVGNEGFLFSFWRNLLSVDVNIVR